MPIRYFGFRHRFSHLHPSKISLLGRVWYTVEQPYQCAKALLAQDFEVANLIEQEIDGRQQKRLSHRIRQCNQDLWETVKQPIMIRLDHEKYLQNIELREYLLSTADRELVEDNPRDPYWGGQRNKAGKVLMLLRDHFRGVSSLPQILIIADSVGSVINSKRISKKLNKNIQLIFLPTAKIQYISQAAHFLVGQFVETVVFAAGRDTLISEQQKARFGPKKFVSEMDKLAKQLAQYQPKTKVVISKYLIFPKEVGTRVATHILRCNDLLCQMQDVQVVQLISFYDDSELTCNDDVLVHT